MVFKLGLTDANHCDDFDARNCFKFTWSNRRENELLYTRLDRAHVEEWARERGGKLKIIKGMGTLLDHHPILLTIRK